MAEEIQPNFVSFVVPLLFSFFLGGLGGLGGPGGSIFVLVSLGGSAVQFVLVLLGGLGVNLN